MALKSTSRLSDILDLQQLKGETNNIKDFIDELQSTMDNTSGHDHSGADKGKAIPAAGIGTDAVETAKVKDANITAVKLATDAVETAKIKDANVTLAKMAASAVDATITTEDVIRKVTKTVTTAQVLALFTTPIELIAAPGATKFIDIVAVHAKLVYVSATYTGTNALEFRYTNGSGAKVAADISSTFINTASGTAVSTSKGQEAEVVNLLNGNVVVAVPTANPAVGDSDIVFTVYYRTITP
jgi:hypothetical protein